MNELRIKSAEINSIEKDISVEVRCLKRDITLSVTMIDGEVVGDAGNGVFTTYIDYFNKIDHKTRQQHFLKIKKYVESHINP